MFARVTTYELSLGNGPEAIESFKPAIERIRELEVGIHAGSAVDTS